LNYDWSAYLPLSKWAAQPAIYSILGLNHASAGILNGQSQGIPPRKLLIIINFCLQNKRPYHSPRN